MAQLLTQTLPGINPTTKSRLQFTNHTLVGTGNATVTTSQLRHGLLSMTPTADRNVTLPDAVDIINDTFQFTGAAVSDAIPFIIRNQAALGSTFQITVVMGTGGTNDAGSNLTIEPGTYHEYVLRIDDATPSAAAGPPGPAAYTVFQVNSGAADGGPAAAAYLSAAVTPAMPVDTDEIDNVAAIPLDGLVFVTAAGVAPAVGITAATDGVTGSTNWTVANAGIYKIGVSLSANIAGDDSALVFVRVAVGGVANAQNLFAVGNDAAMTDPHGDGSGEIILPLAAGAVVALFVIGSSAMDLTASVEHASISIVRIA